MAIYSYIGYSPGSLIFSGATITLDSNFNVATDRRVFEVNDAPSGNIIGGGGDSHVDNGVRFDGDRYTDELGDDATQFGTVESLDGTVTYNSGRIYLEQSYTLTAPGEPTIQVYRVEIGGTFVGHITSAPLSKGVTYAYTTANVTPGNAPNTTDSTALVDVPCFLAGTPIETPDGVVAIETLQAGDTVRLRDGSFARITWAGKRALVPSFHAAEMLQPVRIAAGALGPGLPQQDICVSPNHRIMLEGADVELYCGRPQALVAAKFLLGLPGVSQMEGPEPVTYVHLLFENHCILDTAGLGSESLHPGDVALNAYGQEAAEEVRKLFPELSRSVFTGYGPLALPSLSAREAKCCMILRKSSLAVRAHQANGPEAPRRQQVA